MTKTRRQSKRAAAAQEAETSTIEESASAASQLAASTMSIPIPDDLDVELLSNLLPDVNLESPSPDAIVSLYRLVLSQSAEIDATQRELEEARAEAERKEVELDQALQDKETSTKELESTLETVQNELKQVKQEKDEIAASRAALQAQLSSLSTSQSASTSEVDTLKHRIEDVEREKRDLIGVVSRLKEDSSQRDEEINTLRSNLKQARQEYQSLESQVRELRSTETSNKFKLETLTQQLELAKSEVERTSADLAAKSEEFANYRRQKRAELAQLQAAHDSLAQTHAATESSLKTLQANYTNQSHQLTQALARVHDLSSQLAEQEATYSSEAAGLHRLIQMMEEREAQAKEIVENIEKEWAGVGERAERREVVLREEIEAQRQRAEAAEKRVSDLEKVLDRMDRGEFPIPSASAPGTPARGLTTPVRNGTPGTPDFLTQGMMGLSPTVAMASRVQKGGKTFTEVYADYVKLQEDYARKCMEYDHMDRTLSAVLAQIEERAPILAQQRQEYERLQSEASLLASQLSEALSERDECKKTAEETSQKLTKSTRENDFLNKQLSDLGRQVQVLLKELGRIQDPLIPSDQELEADPSIKPAEDIEAVITNNLVLFRSIPQLQEQNQKLLKIVRELGAKMEAEEKEYREQLEKEQSEAVQEAHQAIKLLQEQLENQKKSADITIQAYIKERDALKSTLARERASGAGRGVNGDTAVAMSGVEPGPSSGGTEELVQVQSQFEAYKTEIGVDTVRLREEVLTAQREAGKAAADLAKANAKIEYLTDRNRMLQDQVTMQSREVDNLARRNQEMYDQYTRVDIEFSRVSEDLLSVKSVAEQLRNECANLRAEKKIWESVQSRLVEENRTLSVERSQLSDLMANVQRMHSDLERSGENDRRRLESQIQMLESQTQDLRSQLSQERENNRYLTLQKDLELKDLRTRLDKTTQEYSEAREALARAETSKKHLEQQVEQLSRQLQGNEEKLAVYERRASGANNVTPRTDQDLSREQQLEAEVAELRSALKVAEVDLAAARSHVQQFQEISQANEAALASLNATFDEYKSTTESELTTRESEYNALQGKLAATQQELSQLSAKYNELQRTLESERAAWASDKKTLEDAIVDITASEKSTESDRVSREETIRQLEERAKSAEEKYSREIVAHAESIKSVEELRAELHKAQASARDNLAAAETAQAKLATSESSWKQQKDALDKEISDLNSRIRDLNAQNNLLHQHLESVTSQAARIRETANSAAAPASSSEGDNTDSDTKLAELRSVVSYLRKEKEIVELQLDLSKQENTRLKTQIEHLNQTLEETRRTLSEERERAVEAASSEAQHAELVERINQLTILRESNSTLRADCEAQTKRARNLEIKLQQLTSELDPLREELRVTKAELEAKDAQVKRLEDESRRWQERNTQLLTKYDRIDPVEMQSLKDQIEVLQKSKEELEKSFEERERQYLEKIASTEASLHKSTDTGKKNNAIYKKRFEEFSRDREQFAAKVSELEEQIKALTAERDALLEKSNNSSREEELKQELENVRREKAELEKSLAEERAKAGSSDQSALILTEERDKLLAEKASSATTAVPSASVDEEVQKKWEGEKTELIKARDAAQEQIKAAQKQLDEARREVQSVKQSHTTLMNKMQELMKARNADKEKATAEIEKLKQELQSNAPAETVKKHADELRALEERLTQKHQEELKAALEAAAAAKDSGAAAIPADREEAIKAALAAREAELKEEREKEIAEALERGRMEAATRSKLKDSQLVRAQKRLKDLEAQIEEWKAKGLLPVEQPPAASSSGDATSPVTSAPAASTSTTNTSTTNTAGPSTTPAAASTPTNAAAPGPSGAAKTVPAKTGPAGRGNGAGSNLPPKPMGAGRGRGAPSIRGAARNLATAAGLNIKGASDSQASAAETNAGAAGKRTREDGEEAPASSLAKRMKSAESGGAGGSSKPVTLNRNRVGPS
ncbi:hypothetical protein K474DRAFT_1635534 [Panus rudis PR-1116 ss-1]|nr:hypothetical protein K474DRAFT_1635534 [Panus rudis PR-1116 ss-1]